MSGPGDDNPAQGKQRKLRNQRAALGVAVWGLLCLVLLSYNHYPGRLSLHVGEKSPRDIRALRTVKYVDAEETQRLKEDVAREVEPVYSRVPFALADAEKDLRGAFSTLRDAEQSANLANRALRDRFPGVSRATLAWFLAQDNRSRQKIQRDATDLLRDQMAQDIRDGEAGLEQARDRTLLAADHVIHPRAAADLVGGAVSAVLRPSRRFDAGATEQRRKEVMAEVKGIERPLQPGDIVIMKGERAGPHHLAMLRALGLTSPWSAAGWAKTAALVLLVLLGVIFLGMAARQFSRPTYESISRLGLLGLVVCGATFLFNLFLLPLPNLSMLFLPVSTLIIAILLSRQLAFAAAVVQSVLAAIAGDGSLVVALPALGSCMAALVSADHIWPPSRLLRASAQLAIANAVLALVAGALSDLPTADLWREVGMGFGYGAFAPALALGVIFLLQKPFDITSHIRLLEISNPREPLLSRLQAEAPGTYYSCIIVANLAEAAAQAVGADSLLARVGAMYHDIGKLRRPGLFVENQFLLGTENAHARLSPYLSALVILAHVRDGVELARRYGLPKVIQDIIEEHHGTSLVSYFYHQARARQSGPPPQEGHYRYEGRKPRSKESAIVMLADSVQAAVKSLAEPNLERIEAMIQEIFTGRLQDGQLQDAELTFRDLETVKQCFVRSLQGIHLHTRIEYPNLRVLDEDASIDSEHSEAPRQPGRSQTHGPGRNAG